MIDTSMNYDTIMSELKTITKSRETKKFTIPEGYELKQIVDKLSAENLIDREKFMHLVEYGKFHHEFIKDLPIRKNRLEGYLFPDTYEIYTDTSEEDIIKKMLDRFEQKFESKYYKKSKQLNMTIDQVITLASIIEREAMLDEERYLISSVFHNRLKSNEYPFLQSCATVQYILGERKPILSIQDTKIDSPYNTYKFSGLPPGPIASPGEKAIEAALYPEETEYMFFSANNDGSHTFSKTYEQHLNVSN